MALSLIWTGKDIWREGTLDTPDYLQGKELYVDRLNLMNRHIQMVIGQFYDLVKISYMTPVTPVISSSGRYSTVGGTWVASTNTLTITMNSNFASSDVGNLIVFRVSASVYVATIQSRTSNTVVVLTGDNLPSSNQTVDYAIMAATTLTSDAISIASLRMARAGQQIGLELESTVTTSIRYMTSLEINMWRTSEEGNSNSIAVALSGTTLLLKKGSELSSYGTLTLRYPKVPDSLATEDDYADIPDGVIPEIVIISLRSAIARRLGKKTDEQPQLEALIRKLYQTFNMEVDAEVLKEKAQALK